jgi:hypothetical protein
MISSPVGKFLRLAKSATVTVVEEHDRCYFTSLPEGTILTIKSIDCTRPTVFVGVWLGKELLVYERDISDALVFENRSFLTSDA